MRQYQETVHGSIRNVLILHEVFKAWSQKGIINRTETLVSHTTVSYFFIAAQIA